MRQTDTDGRAYVICHTAGLTTAAYSFGYVAHWSEGDPAKVKATAERVVSAARAILHTVGLLEPLPAPQPETIAA